MNAAFYRCRLCGEIFTWQLPGDKLEGRFAMEDTVKGEPLTRHQYHAPLLGVHACNNEDTGLADLQGIKWVVKNGTKSDGTQPVPTREGELRA